MSNQPSFAPPKNKLQIWFKYPGYRAQAARSWKAIRDAASVRTGGAYSQAAALLGRLGQDGSEADDAEL